MTTISASHHHQTMGLSLLAKELQFLGNEANAFLPGDLFPISFSPLPFSF
jgi:hypothetical protein